MIPSNGRLSVHLKTPFPMDGRYPTKLERTLYRLQVGPISLVVAYVPVFLIRCFLKYFYFNYKGFLFEDRQNPSLTTKFWAICHKLLSFTSPRLCSCDSLLPSLPVPALQDIIERYLETIEPILTKIGDGLLCGCHYRKMYATTRVPGITIDHLENYRLSRHMAVYHKGNFYKVEMFDENNRIYSIPELTKIFADILTRDDVTTRSVAHVAALTTDKRDKWYANRARFFLNNATNKETLTIIETAIAFIVLDDSKEYEYNPDKSERLDNFMRNMLTGDGRNRWADKSLNYCISATARCGGTTEHSIGDGFEFDHLLENFVYMDTRILNGFYPSVVEEVKSPFANGSLSSNGDLSNKKINLKRAERLSFEVDDEMAAEIERCYNTYKQKIEDVDMAATIFRTFGKGRIKQGKLSPDAFVQMAIQLANFKDQHKFVLTYESASARFYANSRTETLRTATKESCAFVRAMIDPDCDNEERYRLLKVACERHVQRNRNCMVGKGVDRHLFVLYILSKAISVSSPFLDYYISQPWLLSTSQAPTLTGQMDEDTKVEDSWIGASFGPVAKHGYGICYRFAGNHSICVHISSLKSAGNTQACNAHKEDMKRSKALMDKRFDEMLANVSTTAKVSQVRSDMSLTAIEEEGKIWVLYESYLGEVRRLFMEIEKATHEHHKKGSTTALRKDVGAMDNLTTMSINNVATD
ncbi:Carnitine O-palmitoyltransferase 1, liver isoform [Toxocara canis]|uniref:Carnitine O-palmitoyltransferase 1, liver isoform n=1 Tax=Toxocara canis TaxID=6265 RepID=A0A0B2V2P2_TOXCA|nr:Carnitine O-palmitoyltransferase 1, liver isoform [Toxocara canis]